MNFIICALKAEAQAFKEYYKLKKISYENITFFQNEDITLFTTGLSNATMQKNLTLFLSHFELKKDDKIINIGICAAPKSYEVGELCFVSTIVYNNEKFLLNNKNYNTITSLDCPATKEYSTFVDMESFGFYKALERKEVQKFMFKVVSDHFEPQNVTKDFAKKIVFKKIAQIMESIG